jgi:ABC-type branched-subunit amino acid transport system substrate-binding protein
LVAAAMLAACGGVDSGTGGSGSGGTGASSETGPGVTADSITLGHLTDLSGPFAPTGKEYLAGAQLYVSNKNAAGGVCGRQIKLEVKDHGYNAQKAATLYTEMAPKVLGLEGSVGSGVTGAILPQAAKDNMLVSPMGFEVGLLQTQAPVLMASPTFEVLAANVVSWAIQKNNLKAGDTVGSIVAEGTFGDNSEHGTDVAAKAAGLQVAKTRIKFTDTDFTAPITAMRNAGAKVVIIGGSAAQHAAIMSTASSLGYDPLQWVTSNTGSFNPSLLDGPAGKIMQDKFVMASSGAVWSQTDVPGVKDLHQAFAAQKPQVTPGAGVVFGYGQAQAFTDIVAKSCADLTRAGLVKAFRATKSLDTGGVLLPLDFTRGDGKKSPSLATSIVKPDKAADGGLKLVEAAYTSDAVKGSGL